MPQDYPTNFNTIVNSNVSISKFFVEITIPEIMFNRETPKNLNAGKLLLPRNCTQFSNPPMFLREPAMVECKDKKESTSSLPFFNQPNISHKPFILQNNYSTQRKDLKVPNETKVEESICNFQLLTKALSLTFAKGNFEKDTLKQLFESFEYISVFGVTTQLYENDKLVTFSFSPSLSSFELEINNYESFLRLIEAIQVRHPLLRDAINNYFRLSQKVFGSRLVLDLAEGLKLLLVGNVARLSFYEARPAYSREVLSDFFEKLLVQTPYLGDIRLCDINIFTSYFSIMFSPLNTEKSPLGKASFLAYYSFHAPKITNIPVTIPFIGIVPIKLDESKLAVRVFGKNDESSKYFRELMVLNKVFC